MLGMKRLPGADALGDWLRRMGQSRAGLRGLEALNRQLLKAALSTRRSVTLDLDATAILCDKRETRYTYQKERGYMPMVGHIADGGAYCRGGDDRVAAVSSWQCAALEG